MLCGQVQIGAGNKAAWSDFATVKTKPFEQWIGSAASEMCAHAIPVSSDDDDLSALIEARMKLHEIP